MSNINLPSSSIIVFEMPDKIIFTANEGELETKKINWICETLTEFIKNEEKVACYLPDNLTLMFFHKGGTTDVISTDLTSGNIHQSSSEESSSDTGPSSGNSKGWEDSEDDYE